MTPERRKRESAESRRRSRSLGRRIAIGLVASSLAYLIGVGLISVVPQVFWPEAAEVDASVRCVDGLRELRRELLAFAGEHVAAGGSEQPRRVRDFLARWDLRHRGLEARCTSEAESDAWVALARMRERLQGTLERFDQNEGALARSVDSTLARLER